MSADEGRMFDQICKRAEPNFVVPNVKAHVEFRFGQISAPQILAQLEKHYSATVYYTGVGAETSYEHGWTKQ